jgi:hypothetical protein
MRRLALVLLLSLAAPTLVAAQGSPPRAACQAPEFHQFDFWIGDWEVRNPEGGQQPDRAHPGRLCITGELDRRRRRFGEEP